MRLDVVIAGQLAKLGLMRAVATGSVPPSPRRRESPSLAAKGGQGRCRSCCRLRLAAG